MLQRTNTHTNNIRISRSASQTIIHIITESTSGSCVRGEDPAIDQRSPGPGVRWLERRGGQQTAQGGPGPDKLQHNIQLGDEDISCMMLSCMMHVVTPGKWWRQAHLWLSPVPPSQWRTGQWLPPIVALVLCSVFRLAPVIMRSRAY